MSEPETLRHLLRSARRRLPPESFGIPSSRRRAPGLSCEDVAELVGISETWYARFEAGRARMSIKTLHRLAEVLCLNPSERASLLRLALPEVGRLAHAPTAGATRELRAFRRFQHRAESASSAHELGDMAIEAVLDAIPNVAYTSIMSKSGDGTWLHRSTMYPDTASAINAAAPLRDEAIARFRIDFPDLVAVGSADYGTAQLDYLQDRSASTELRSGFGVHVPLSASYVGYGLKERGTPDAAHLLLLGGVASTMALTLTGTSF